METPGFIVSRPTVTCFSRGANRAAIRVSFTFRTAWRSIRAATSDGSSPGATDPASGVLSPSSDVPQAKADVDARRVGLPVIQVPAIVAEMDPRIRAAQAE